MPANVRMFNSSHLPKPSFHWSTACEVTNPTRMVFTAGQGARDETGAIVGKGDCVAQVKQGFKNMGVVLAERGMDFTNVVRFTVYLVNADDIPAFTTAREQVYKEIYTDGQYPPTTLVVVSRLRPPDLLFEFDAIAVA
jgi:enamine deaminase RidA (YjgF/YER057c/UK114 family)